MSSRLIDFESRIDSNLKLGFLAFDSKGVFGLRVWEGRAHFYFLNYEQCKKKKLKKLSIFEVL